MDIAVIEFEDGFTIAVNARRWTTDLMREARRLGLSGLCRITTFQPAKNGFRRLERCYARI
jgi:tRNA U34 5-methylaminomethyl-2-thiouridine-forming methyltransferase MnmC